MATTTATALNVDEFLRVYFNKVYSRWTVDVLKPRHVERKTFPSKDKAELFAMAKRSELLEASPSPSPPPPPPRASQSQRNKSEPV